MPEGQTEQRGSAPYVKFKPHQGEHFPPAPLQDRVTRIKDRDTLRAGIPLTEPRRRGFLGSFKAKGAALLVAAGLLAGGVKVVSSSVDQHPDAGATGPNTRPGLVDKQTPNPKPTANVNPTAEAALSHEQIQNELNENILNYFASQNRPVKIIAGDWSVNLVEALNVRLGDPTVNNDRSDANYIDANTLVTVNGAKIDRNNPQMQSEYVFAIQGHVGNKDQDYAVFNYQDQVNGPQKIGMVALTSETFDYQGFNDSKDIQFTGTNPHDFKAMDGSKPIRLSQIDSFKEIPIPQAPIHSPLAPAA